MTSPEAADRGATCPRSYDGVTDLFRHVLRWDVREYQNDASVQPEFRWDRSGGLAFVRLRVEEPIRLVAEAAADGYVVVAPAEGVVNVRTDVGEWDLAPGRALVIGAGDHVDLRAGGHRALALLRVTQTAVDDMLRALTRGPLVQPVRFAPVMDLHAGPGLSWYRLWCLFVAELERPDSYLSDPWAADQFERMLLAMLLRWQPHDHRSSVVDRHEPEGAARSGEGRPRPLRVYPPYVAKVLEIVAEHPEWEHTTGSLARFASISERALQLRFKRHLGVSPMVHLRNTRLDRVHATLLDSDAAEVTLEQLVGRWGFHHYGHFSALYRARFGERPSETLARSRTIDLVS